MQAAVDAFGQLDIVVNNAGYTWDGIAHKMSDEQFRAMLEIHTVVPFRVLRAAAPHLREPAKQEGGRGTRGLPQGRQRHVDRRHAGQRRAGELLGREGRARRPDEDARARVGAVQGERERGRVRLRRDAPDGRRRRGRRDVRARRVEIQLGIPQQMRELAPKIIPLGRPATPEEAAGPIFFLCTPWSNFVHGQVITASGGQTTGMTMSIAASSSSRSTRSARAAPSVRYDGDGRGDRSAYAEATDDPSPRSSAARRCSRSCPVWEAIAPASRSVATDEARKRVVHCEQDMRAPPADRGRDDGSCRARRRSRCSARPTARRS